MGDLIVLERLAKRFGSHTVFEDATLRVEAEERVVILGPSGIGKSTLLRLIAGLENPDEGAIYLNGQEVSQVPPHLRNVAWLPQGACLWSNMTVRDNARFVSPSRGVSIDRNLRGLGIGDVADRPPHTLSGGQARRAAIARALAAERPIVLLDEPFAHLGGELAQVCARHIVGSLTDSRSTMIAVGHDRSVAELLDARPVDFVQIASVPRPQFALD
ncbi:MAG: ATP-binding cassette domain-containing protein [Fimbriimonadaceae bacterium]|nr:ATP-binding cassette domain-containing protein [Fimbriimonadaceae bacterium]